MDPFNQLPCSLSLVWKEEKKKRKEGGGKGGCAVKSRLGSELLFPRGPEASLNAGARHNNAMFELGGEAQREALAGLCVGYLVPSSDPKCEPELRHCIVAETSFVPGKKC